MELSRDAVDMQLKAKVLVHMGHSIVYIDWNNHNIVMKGEHVLVDGKIILSAP